MKPQPMSDAEIDAMLLQHGASGDWTDDEFESAASLVAKAIAARDAQWAAMIGEPFAWLCYDKHTCTTNENIAKTWAAAGIDSMPLYAIKETP